MHPMHEHMQHKKEKSRVHHIVHGYAHGGSVYHHEDAAEDMEMIRREVKPSALKHHKPHKAEGGAVASRQDKPARRARGGRTGHKGKGHTNVNVIVAPQGHAAGGPPMMAPHPAMAPPPAGGLPPGAMPPGAMPPGGAPGLPPHPPMAGPGMPPGGPGMMPPGMPPRRNGGRIAFAKGGGIKSGAAYEEGIRAGTKVQNNPTGKNDLGNLHRGKPITYKTGGAIEAPKTMGPKFRGGAGGGEARLEKRQAIKRANA